MRLSKFMMRFRGPHSAELFKLLYIKPTEYDHVFIGSGESKAVAAARAVSHMQGYGLGPIMEQIESEVDFHSPHRATFIEGDQYCQVYCIIGISADD